MTTQPNTVKRITQAHQDRFAQWEREREDFVALHGQAAWDKKIDREIKELYPES